MKPIRRNRMPRFECINVALGARAYEIVIGSQLLPEAGNLIKPIIRGNRVIIVSDQIVAPLYLNTLVYSLKSAEINVEKIILPPGEKTKSIKHFENLVDDILTMKIDRNVALVALGGGVIGDLVGYAAASILRGVDFIQVPTTLLSQVDSSVGGKTGINTPQGKNLIGAFYQPRMVITDIDTLDSLPERQVLAGYAEVVKYGLINNPEFFMWLEECGVELCTGQKDYRRKAISISCDSKAKIVIADETEQNSRALLNLGHTFGHALETETGFSDKLLHGESVSLGICMAFDLSLRLGLCGEEEVKRIKNHFAAVGLPTKLADIPGISWNKDTLLKHMLSDKKTKNGKVNFILTRGIGKSFITGDVDMKDVGKTIEQSIQ